MLHTLKRTGSEYLSKLVSMCVTCYITTQRSKISINGMVINFFYTVTFTTCIINKKKTYNILSILLIFKT